MSVRSLVRSGLISFAETRSMLVGNATYVEPAYQLITTSVLSTSQPSVVFDNLEQYASLYKHLEIRGSVRSTAAATNDTLILRFNSNSTSNYVRHEFVSLGNSGVNPGGATGQTSLFLAIPTGANSPSNEFSAFIAHISDPFSLKNKSSRSLNHWPSNQLRLDMGALFNTDPVNSITLTNSSTSNIAANSRFSLYGVRS
jgi:hypothetical protein